MFNKISKTTGFINHKSSFSLYQKVDSLLGLPCTDDVLTSLSLTKPEVLTLDEVKALISLSTHEAYGEYVNSLLTGSSDKDDFGIIEPVIEFIHSKRFFVFLDLQGVRRIVGIPSNRVISSNKTLDSFSKALLAVGKSYVDFLSKRTPENEVAEFARFAYRVQKLQEITAKRLVSKNFKNKFQFNFVGLSGVALTGNLSADGVSIPKWYAREKGIKIGDLVLVTRDPIQNIFISLKVESFTRNEIRINSQTITLLDGDFDGDKLQVIPFCNIMSECDRLGVTETAKKAIVSELTDLLPTSIMGSERFSRLVRDYSL
ncbi:MAG: hypothetical protein ACRC0G_11955 [Fusobacteriaceae bacterium]